MPRFKSVSFPGAPHPVALKFADDDPLYERVADKPSADIREAIHCRSYDDLVRRSRERNLSPHAFIHEQLEKKFDGPPVERRYSGWPAATLGTAEATRDLVLELKARHVLDPFAGRADLAAAAAQVPRVRALYCETSPVFRFVAEARCEALFYTPEGRESAAADLVRFAEELPREPSLESLLDAPPLVTCAAIEALPRTDFDPAQFGRDLRNEIANGVAYLRNEPPLQGPVLRIANDARTLRQLQPLGIDCVITNPPSLNFASYSPPSAMSLVGARRPPPRKLMTPREAIKAIRRLCGARAAKRIESDVAKLERANQRMARTAANYFADMADAFAAVTTQMTPLATFAIEVSESRLAGLDIETPAHLKALLGGFGFSAARNHGPFRVMTRR